MRIPLGAVPRLPGLAPLLRLLDAVAEHRTEQPLGGGAPILNSC